MNTDLFGPSALAGVAGLRAWALGWSADEAAVELLAGLSVDGWAVDPSRLWVRACHRPGWFWLDGPQLRSGLTGFPVADRPVAGAAALLMVGGTLRDVREISARLDRGRAPMVRAALAYGLWSCSWDEAA